MDFARLPKVELHRHLEGCVRFETFLDIAREAKLELPSKDPRVLRRLVQVGPRDPRTLPSFLEKFVPLRNLYPSRDAIERVAREAVEDSRADGIHHLELRFSPVHFARRLKADPVKVAGWIIAAAKKAARGSGLSFIITFGRDFDLKTNEPSLRAAIEHAGDVVAVDLAGDERRPAAPFRRFFREAKRAGLKLTVHAGEGAGPGNVREAIEELGADRIGHGVRAVEDPAVLRLADERGVAFEMCPTSNLQTGAVKRLADHPLRSLLRAGQRVTINTDDPAISGISLTQEFGLASRRLRMTLADLAQATRNAALSAFVPDPEALEQRIAGEWERASR